ncbi:MAG TPA: peptide deformylase [Terriglobales bacterium]|nr:peptide deformylase [Terriglobales bacterium]
MLYPIVKFPDPVLTTPAAPVATFATPELRQLVADMFASMYAASGVGLAAPQIGLARRLTVIDCSAGEDLSQQLVLLNPEILHREGKQTGEEGCLSLPGFRADVTRALRVKVRAQNLAGEWFEAEGTDLLARAMQHEIDHLNGVLFITHLSTLKRDLIKRKIRQRQKAGDW